MSRRHIGIAAIAVVAALLGVYVWTRGMAQTPRPTVREEKDIVFTQQGDLALKVDVAMPANRGNGPFPAVLCLHGGGWISGGRLQMSQTLGVLARRGYVAVSADYRLAPVHRFPACVEDCKAAVRWLRANAGKYRIDPNRIGVVGLAAGGHLACLLGVTDTGDGLDGHGYNDQSSAVQAVVALAAPTDLTDASLWTPECLTKNLEPLLGGPPREKMDLYRKASPVHYAPRKPSPLLLIHGGNDVVVPVAQAQAMAERVNRHGGKARVHVLADEGHTWNGFALLESIDKMLSFLDETLKP